MASLLHLPKRRLGEALDQISRVLRPGGGAFIALKRGQGERVEGGPFGDRYFAYYEPAELTSALSDAGLELAEMRTRFGGGAEWVCAWCRAAGV